MRILKQVIIFTIILTILIVVNLNWRKIKIQWIKLSKQDAIFFNYNSENNLGGEILQYKAGKIYVIGNLTNGVKQGWETMFYENEKLKSRTYFVNGLPAGKGYLYNNEGKLAYSGGYNYGQPYGDWYEYYPNGNIKRYLLYDLENKKSFTVDYEINGRLKLKNMSGFVVSPYFYSTDPNGHVVLLSKKENPTRRFSNINDLNITIANPMHTRLSILIKINKSQYDFYEVKSNTITIANAFLKKGNYEVFVESHLYDENNKVINGININYSLIKE